MRVQSLANELSGYIAVLTEGSEKSLKKLPAGTEIKNSLYFSVWNGYLAMVDGPSYSDAYGLGPAPEWQFDAAQMKRKYTVRFAVDIDGKRIKLPSSHKTLIGSEIHTQNSRVEYWKTTWSYGGYGGRSPMRGSFEKKTEVFAVEMKPKDLYPREVRAVRELYLSWNYMDITGYPIFNLKQAEWKKILSKKKFVDTQDLDSKLADAAYELVIKRNDGKTPRDAKDDQIIWEHIAGVFKLTKDNKKLVFILPKRDL